MSWHLERSSFWVVSRDPWKGNKYGIHWRSSLESCLPDYCCALILWRGTASSCFFFFFLYVCWFASSFESKNMEALKCSLICGTWESICIISSVVLKETAKQKKKRTFSFSSCLPSGSTSESLEEVLVPGAARQPCYLRNTTNEFPGNGEDKESEAICSILSFSDNRPRTCLQTQKKATLLPILKWMMMMMGFLKILFSVLSFLPVQYRIPLHLPHFLPIKFPFPLLALHPPKRKSIVKQGQLSKGFWHTLSFKENHRSNF